MLIIVLSSYIALMWSKIFGPVYRTNIQTGKKKYRFTGALSKNFHLQVFNKKTTHKLSQLNENIVSITFIDRNFCLANEVLFGPNTVNCALVFPSYCPKRILSFPTDYAKEKCFLDFHSIHSINQVGVQRNALNTLL